MENADDTGKKRILIIDDDELNSKAIAKRLERKGFIVKIATDENINLEIIEKENIDLILLDIVMPKIDGISLLKKIRLKYALDILPILMVTVINDSKEILDAFDAGANDYLTKPVNIDAATSRIKGQLNSIELYRERAHKLEAETINALVIKYNHEINNPLAIIQGQLQLMAAQDPNMNQKKLEIIFHSIDRIVNILKKARDAAKKKQISYELYADKSKMLKIE